MNDRRLLNIERVLLIVAIVGAVNWGLIGVFDFNLVDALFGGGSDEQTSVGSRVVYALVGLAGVLALVLFPVLKSPRTTAYANH